MASFSSISIRFHADLKEFSSSIDNAQRQMKKIGGQMKRVGSSWSTNFTAPVMAGLALVTKGTEEFRADLGRLETNAQMAGEKMGFIRDQLKSVQAITGETDSSVEGLSNLLASGFRGENLTAALNGISGAAVKFSDTLKFEGIADGLQETLATGAAIGPFAEMLERSGVNLEQFNSGLEQAAKNGNEQNYVLKTLADQGLNDVNEKYRENNRDVVEARKSQMAFQLAIADLGRTLQPIVTKITTAVTGLVAKFNDLSPATKQVMMVMTGVAAAIGPILYGLGSLLTILPSLGAAFTAMTGPIGLVVAAIAGISYVIYENWDTIKKYMVDLQNYFIDLYNESTAFRVAVEHVILVFKTLWNVVKTVFSGLWGLVKDAGKYIIETFKNVGTAIKAALTGNISDLPGIFKKQTALMASSFGDALGNIGNQINSFTDTLKTDFDDALNAVTKRKKIDFKATATIGEVITSSTNNGGVNPAGGEGESRSIISPLNELEEPKPFKNSPFDLIAPKMQAQAAIMTAAQMKFQENNLLIQENAAQFNQGITEILNNTAANFAIGFGEILGHMMTGQAGLAEMGKLAMQTFANMAIQIGQMAIKIGFATEAVKEALTKLGGVGAIAAGIALVALGNMVKSSFSSAAKGGGGSMPRFANGGLVYSPTVGLVGEYAGARTNPEVIAPLDKLKSMISDSVGGGELKVSGQFKLDGKDLKGSLDRTNAYLGRRG